MHERDLFKRISLYNYEGWQVSRSTVGKLEIRRTSGRVLVQNSAGLRLKKSWSFSSSPKAGKNCCPNSRQSGNRNFLLFARGEWFFFFFLSRSLLIEWNLLTLERATYFTQMAFWCLPIIQHVAYLLKTRYKYKYISSSNICYKTGHKGNKRYFVNLLRSCAYMYFLSVINMQWF